MANTRRVFADEAQVWLLSQGRSLESLPDCYSERLLVRVHAELTNEEVVLKTLHGFVHRIKLPVVGACFLL